MEKKPSVNVEETLSERICAAITNSAKEFDVTMAQTIGCLEIVKAELISTALKEEGETEVCLKKK